jgi:hypothetical protein
VGHVTTELLGRGVTAVVGAVIAALLMAGCSPEPVKPPPAPTEAEIETIMEKQVELLVANRLLTYPDLWDQVKFERFVSPDEAPTVQNECLREYGVTQVIFLEDGAVTGDLGDFERAVMDACSFSYPYDFQAAGVQSDAQLEYSYNYTTNFLVPCLRAQRYTFESPPSHEDYLRAAHESLWVWSPYDTINFTSDRRWSNLKYDSPELATALTSLRARCPAYADGIEPRY